MHAPPPDLPKLEDAIARSKRWMEDGASLISGASFPSTPRNRVSGGLYHLSIEHQSGIHVLVDQGVIGSAFALLRPQVEAYMRASWYLLCASDNDVQRFIKGHEPPSIGKIIEQLEKTQAYHQGHLSEFKTKLWDNLCGFTHGGIIQVKARLTVDEVKPNYKLRHIIGLLDASALLCKLACVGVAAIQKSNQLATRLYMEYLKIYEPETDVLKALWDAAIQASPPPEET